MKEEGQGSPRWGDPRRDEMKTPDDVSAMARLKALGWGLKRIAAELGCSRNTVRRWLQYGDWRPRVTPSRSRKLDGLADWLADRFRRHGGNADVIRQELAEEKAIHVSLRTVERAVAPLRREFVAAARATVRFETRPGRSADWEAARDLFTRAIKTTAPTIPAVFEMRAQAEVELGLLDAALLDLRRLVSLDSTKALHHLAIADVLFGQAAIEEALEENAIALTLAPKDPLGLRQRGWLEFFDKRNDEALADLAQAASLNPKDAYAALWLDIASERTGHGERLQAISKDLDMTTWPAAVVRFYRGEIGVDALIAASANADPTK